MTSVWDDMPTEAELELWWFGDEARDFDGAKLRSDIDGNGAVDVQDVLWAIYYFNRSPNGDFPVGAEVKKLDLNGDNLFDSADVLLAVTDVNGQAAAAELTSAASLPSSAADGAAGELNSLAYLLAEDLVASRKRK